MESKQLKDYLPFYLGCDVEVTSLTNHLSWPIRKLVGVINDTETDDYLFITVESAGLRSSEYLRAFEVKPILRKLSSMTEEEKQESLDLWNQYSPTEESPHSFIADAIQTKYMLDKGFDLFGLIESGLAIDSSTIQVNNQIKSHE